VRDCALPVNSSEFLVQICVGLLSAKLVGMSMVCLSSTSLLYSRLS